MRGIYASGSVLLLRRPADPGRDRACGRSASNGVPTRALGRLVQRRAHDARRSRSRAGPDLRWPANPAHGAASVSSGGVKCATDNPRVKQKCTKCGGPRPKPSRRPIVRCLIFPTRPTSSPTAEARTAASAAAAAEGWPSPQGSRARKGEGLARGLLCWTCNLALRDFATPEWLNNAAGYLERAERWRGINLEALL
jgi:hypothetical protein